MSRSGVLPDGCVGVGGGEDICVMNHECVSTCECCYPGVPTRCQVGRGRVESVALPGG